MSSRISRSKRSSLTEPRSETKSDSDACFRLPRKLQRGRRGWTDCDALIDLGVAATAAGEWLGDLPEVRDRELALIEPGTELEKGAGSSIVSELPRFAS